MSLWMATNRICHADCHAESCGNALYVVACSSGKCARLFPGERDGRGLAQRSVPKGEVAAGQRGRSIICRRGQISRVGIHHSWSDRASRRTLYRTSGEPPRKWRSLEGSGYLGRRCQRQRSVCQFLYPPEKTVKHQGQSVQKVATVATFVATLRPRHAWFVAAVAAVATPRTMALRQTRLRR